MGLIGAATSAHLKLVLAEVARLKLQIEYKLTSKKENLSYSRNLSGTLGSSH
jgi:hypothetical protein